MTGIGLCPKNSSCTGSRSCSDMGMDNKDELLCSDFQLCEQKGLCSELELCFETDDCQTTCNQSDWFMYHGVCLAKGNIDQN